MIGTMTTTIKNFSPALRNYLLTNGILICFLLAGIVYFKYSSLPVRCYYQSYYGTLCPSCGLSRDFSRFLSSDFHTAINVRSYGYFVFFVWLFVSRWLHSFIAYCWKHTLWWLIGVDIIGFVGISFFLELDFFFVPLQTLRL